MLILRIVGYVWALPVAIIGLLLAIWYRPRSWRWSDGCIEAISDHMISQPAAQTWGFVVYYATESIRNSSMVRVHERVHTLQTMVLGILFLPAYALHFLWLYVFAPKEPANRARWVRAYRRIWAERQAYRIEAEFARGDRPDSWGA